MRSVILLITHYSLLITHYLLLFSDMTAFGFCSVFSSIIFGFAFGVFTGFELVCSSVLVIELVV